MKLELKYKTTSPISHISKTESNASFFNTVKAFDKNSNVIDVPIITANSVRGQLRNSASEYLHTILNKQSNLQHFAIFFSGGNISGTMNNDIKRAKEIKDRFPIISMFGAGIGDMILSGKMQVSNIIPLCSELGTSDKSIKDLLGNIEFTRSDDLKNEELVSKYSKDEGAIEINQMRYEVEYLVQGTDLVQTIHLQDSSEIEIGCLISAFWQWWNNKATLGGMANKGFGFFDCVISGDLSLSIKDSKVALSKEAQIYFDKYTDFLNAIKEKNIDDYFSILDNKKAKK